MTATVRRTMRSMGLPLVHALHIAASGWPSTACALSVDLPSNIPRHPSRTARWTGSTSDGGGGGLNIECELFEMG